MDSVAFTIFNYNIKWYSLCILGGVIVALFFYMKEGRRFNYPKEFLFNLFFWVVIFGIIGARLYFCAFHFEDYQNDLLGIFRIWEGGLAIHGGIIAGLITLIFYTKRYNVSTLKMTDISAVPLLIAQAIGRWGNFFNQEAHGAATTYYHLKELHIPEKIIEGMKKGNTYYHPTFFYESVYCLIGFVLLLLIRRFKYIKRGQVTCLYLMYYSVGRFFIERMRTDSLMFGGFKVAQIVSVALFIIGLLGFMILSRKGRFEDLYNEDQRREIKF